MPFSALPGPLTEPYFVFLPPSHGEYHALIELVKPIASTFVGAGLAFIAAKLHDRKRRWRENLASGNRAIHALGVQREHYASFRRNLLKQIESRKDSERPTWCLLFPTPNNYAAHEIDLESLNFLFEHRANSSVIRKLRKCNDKAEELASWRNFCNAAMVEIGKDIARLEQEGPKDWAEIKKGLSKHLVGTGQFVTVGSIRRAMRNSDSQFESAAMALRNALLFELQGPVRRFLRKIFYFQRFISEPPVLMLDPLEERLRASNQPPLPERLRAFAGNDNNDG